METVRILETDTPPGARGDRDARGPRFSLIVLPHGTPSGITPFPAISGITDLSEYDVRQRCLSGRPALLLRSHDRESLEARCQALAAISQPAVVLGDEDIRRERYPFAIRGVNVSRGPIEFLDPQDRPVQTLAGADQILILIANPGQKGGNPVARQTLNRAMNLEELYDDTGRRLNRLLCPPLDDIVLDVVWDSGRRVRIRSGRFNFLTLGDAATASVTINMKTLLNGIMSRSARPILDVGAATIVPPHPGILTPQVVDGFDYDRPDDDAERTHEIYCRYITAAWRHGLFARVTETELVEGRKFFLTRGAMVEEMPSTVAAAAEGPAMETGAAGVVTAGAASTPGPMAHLRRWGPPEWLVPGLVLFAAGAFLSRISPAGPPLTFFAAAFLAFVHGLALFAHRRRIENVPTSKARSVAAGLCEIKGSTVALTPLRTPFSQMPCVYYEFSVMPRSTPQTADVKVTISLTSGGGLRSGDGMIRSGNSGNVPFAVMDGTGQVEVDPRGANLNVSNEQVLYNAPFDGGVIPPGVPVRVREKYIPEGYPVYVMGELKPMGPGGRLRIGRPANSDLFYISEKSEKTIVKSMALRANVIFAMGIIAGALGSLLLIGAMGGWK